MLALNVEFAFFLTDPFFVVVLRCVDAVWFLFCCVVNACERGDSLVWVGLAGTAEREWTLRKLESKPPSILGLGFACGCA